MQSTILLLQQELKTTKERIEHLETEVKSLRDDSKKPLNGIVPCVTSPKQELQPIKQETDVEADPLNLNVNGTSLENGAVTTNTSTNLKAPRQRKRNYDSDASESGDIPTEMATTKRVKRKTRRSSILDSVDAEASADYPEQKTLIDTISEAPAAPTEGTKKILTRRKSSRNLVNGSV